MSAPDLEALAERIEKAMGDAMAAGELGDLRMVGEFVLVGTGFDEDGDACRLVTCNGDLVSALGLLNWGLIRQQAVIYKRVLGDEDVE